MVTRLMWESCGRANFAYGILLRYSAALLIDSNTESFQVEKHHIKLFMFYVSLFVITVVQFAMLSVVVEVRILGTFHAPLYMVLINFAGICMTVGCFGLLLVCLRFKVSI